MPEPQAPRDAVSRLAAEPRERVLIAPPNGWLARDVQARGYVLSEQETTIPWGLLGGVFTPMAHEQTRVLLATPQLPK